MIPQLHINIANFLKKEAIVARERLEDTPCPNESILLRTRLNTINYELIPYLLENEPVVNSLNIKYMLSALRIDMQRNALSYDAAYLKRAIGYIDICLTLI